MTDVDSLLNTQAEPLVYIGLRSRILSRYFYSSCDPQKDEPALRRLGLGWDTSTRPAAAISRMASPLIRASLTQPGTMILPIEPKYLEPGDKWKDVYTELEKHGRRYLPTVARAREGEVGVGGFLPGGGNTFYTAHFDRACDDIVAH